MSRRKEPYILEVARHANTRDNHYEVTLDEINAGDTFPDALAITNAGGLILVPIEKCEAYHLYSNGEEYLKVKREKS